MLKLLSNVMNRMNENRKAKEERESEISRIKTLGSMDPELEEAVKEYNACFNACEFSEPESFEAISLNLISCRERIDNIIISRKKEMISIK